MSQTPEKSSPTGGESAQPAEVKYLPVIPRVGFDETDPKTVSCPTCKTITLQFDARIEVIMANPVAPNEMSVAALELMKKSKRLVFCTHCAGIRVIT